MPSTPRHSMLHPMGQVIVSGPTGTVERDTITCCHCNAIWIMEPGSGRRRGWCLRCNKPTCGSPRCDTCIPFERRLARMEARQSLRRAFEGKF